MSDDGRSADGEPEGGSRDVALIHGITPEGDVRVLRQRSDRLELGALRALREGVPIVGEVVRLKPRKEFPLLCDVETEVTVGTGPVAALTPPAAAAPAPNPAAAVAVRKGPPQVATERYRENWDRIFPPRKPGGELN